MRLIYVSLPLSLLLIGAGIYLATRPAPTIEGNIADLEPRHPVTKIMLDEAERLKLKSAPEIQLPDSDGKEQSLSKDKPTVVLFIKEGCPCSIDAQPIMNKLAEKFKGKAQFLGIIDVDGQKQKQWIAENRPVFPIVADTSLNLMKGYGALNSVYTFLVGPDHRIEKMWPGYWVDMLKELNARLCKDISEKVTEFDPLYAPIAKSSGCAYHIP